MQYFVNMGHNSTDQDVFADIIKVTNHTGLRDTIWYSPNPTRRIYLKGLEKVFGIHGFRRTQVRNTNEISWTILLLYCD